MDDVETLMALPKETLVNMVILLRKKERALKEKLGVALPPAQVVPPKPPSLPEPETSAPRKLKREKSLKKLDKQLIQKPKVTNPVKTPPKEKPHEDSEGDLSNESWLASIKNNCKYQDELTPPKFKDPPEAKTDPPSWKIDEALVTHGTPGLSNNLVSSLSPQFKRALQSSEKLASAFISSVGHASEMAESTAKQGHGFLVGLKAFSDELKKLQGHMLNTTLSDLMSHISKSIDTLCEEQNEMLSSLVSLVAVPFFDYSQREFSKHQDLSNKYYKLESQHESLMSKYHKKITKTPNKPLDEDKEKTEVQLRRTAFEYSNHLNQIRSKDGVNLALISLAMLRHIYLSYKAVTNHIEQMEPYNKKMFEQLEKAQPLIAQAFTLKDHPLEVPPIDKNNPSIEGYLGYARPSSKKDKLVWSRKYIAVKYGQLQKIEIDNGTITRTRYDLTTSSVKHSSQDNRTFVFEFISMTKQGPQNFFLQADNQEQYDLWFDAVTQGVLMAMSSLKNPKTTGLAQSRTSLSAADSDSLMKINPYCADCNAQRPDWTSINLGVMFCIECSGVHRSLGVQTSKCRSLAIDSFDAITLKFLNSVSNEKLNAILEETLPSDPKFQKIGPDTPRPQREDFIRAKYVTKSFVASNSGADWDHVLLNLQTDDPLIALEAVLKGAEPNAVDENGHTAFQKAEDRKLPMVSYVLIYNGWEVPTNPRGLGPLSKPRIRRSAGIHSNWNELFLRPPPRDDLLTPPAPTGESSSNTGSTYDKTHSETSSEPEEEPSALSASHS